MLFFATSCKKHDQITHLTTSKWKLTETTLSNGDIEEHPEVLVDFIIEFEESNNFYLPNNCNYTEGEFEVWNEDSISFSQIGPGTEKYCVGVCELNKEVPFINRLKEAKTYSIVDNKLTIFCGSENLLFENIGQ